MKRILITARNSYVGSNFADWTKEKYEIEFITCRNNDWKTLDFSKFDSILHVAGIAHVSTKRNMEEEYYKVNRDLTIDLAEKAKREGVKQFIFMSSIIVYGTPKDITGKGVINKNTSLKPDNFYGKSKLQAEEGLKKIESDIFKVVVIRPPMIYGKDSKGNYPKLIQLAKLTPIFPDYANQRSMLHIDNLSEFISWVIENEESGTFFPQNDEYVNTSELIKLIAKSYGKKVKFIKYFNPLVNFLVRKNVTFNKVFGNLTYEKEMSIYHENYNIKNFEESISD